MTARRGAILDAIIAWSLFGGYLALLLSTVRDLGYARDEGFYIQAARQYAAWFEILARNPSEAISSATVDRTWAANHEHPAFAKSLFALSYQLLHVEWRLFAEEGTAFRFPGMVLSSMAVAVTYAWGSRVTGRAGGVVAALAFAMMPRVFHHSHLNCFDMPVTAMWLMTTYSYWRSIDERDGAGARTRMAWAVTTGVLYGCLLNTKHNSWLLPAALITHVVLARGTAFWRDIRRGRFGVPWALVFMALIGPPLFYATWPWIWTSTGARLEEYVRFHVAHVHYNMEFLGETYFRPPMPRLYAWVMTLATVPAITLGLVAVGTVSSAVRARVDRRPDSPKLLWLLCILLSYAPWLSSNTPIFGGTKHWITAYPFLAMFAGAGFAAVVARARALLPATLQRFAAVEIALGALVLTAPTMMTLQSHPWGLSAYTPLVGGAPGAASLGLNRTFWGYTTGAMQDEINAAAPRNGRVYVHDTALQSWATFTKDGRIRADLRGTLDIPASNVALYQHEQHMSRVEHQIWVDYGTVRPTFVAAHHGVPVAWFYTRPTD